MLNTELIEVLSTLTEKQLVELFYEVSSRRRNQRAFDKSHLTLVEARITEISDNQGKLFPTWYTEVLCIANPEEYPNGWSKDAPLCQSGVCSECNSECVSYAKEALCAICGSPVYCT